jgi:multicomponent Na+:H+ antiporter subunit G
MRTVVASAAVLAGAGFMFVAGLGIARLPDLYTRMHAAAKPATVGVIGVMCGVAVAFYDTPVTIRAILIAAFFLLTAPVAAHAIARSAHTRGVPLAPGTRIERGDGRRAPGRGPPGPERAPPLARAEGADLPAASDDTSADEMRR